MDKLCFGRVLCKFHCTLKSSEEILEIPVPGDILDQLNQNSWGKDSGILCVFTSSPGDFMVHPKFQMGILGFILCQAVLQVLGKMPQSSSLKELSVLWNFPSLVCATGGVHYHPPMASPVGDFLCHSWNGEMQSGCSQKWELNLTQIEIKRSLLNKYFNVIWPEVPTKASNCLIPSIHSHYKQLPIWN